MGCSQEPIQRGWVRLKRVGGVWTVCRFKGGEANVGKKEWSGGFEGKVHAHYAL